MKTKNMIKCFKEGPKAEDKKIIAAPDAYINNKCIYI